MPLPVLRRNQVEFIERIDAARAQGHKNIMGIAPCGFGKTICLSYLILRESGYTLSMAHRRELVGQLSMALARNGVRHRIIGPTQLIQKIVRKHMHQLGRSFHDANAKCICASVQSINVNNPQMIALLAQVAFFVPDEGHHVIQGSTWGKVIELIGPHAWGFFPTATGWRADGKGLGRHADGYCDVIVYADGMRKLIEDGFLLDYELILATPSDFVRPTDADLLPSGEFRDEAVKRSLDDSKSLIGNTVSTYLEHVPDKQALLFAYNIEKAREETQAFNDAGIKAELVTGESDPRWRDGVFERFERREVKVIVNVGIAGEGTDIPGVEVIIMACPIGSQAWHDQVFGRGARLNISSDLMAKWDEFVREQRLAHIAASAKPHYTVIDHCNNVRTHFPPDAPRRHTLDRRDRRAKAKDDGIIPTRMCLGNDALNYPMCGKPFPKSEPVCPFCGCPVPIPGPGQRRTPEQVDGDLFLLDPDAVELLRQGKLTADAFVPSIPSSASPVVAQSIRNKHRERGQAQGALRETMALWCGAERDAGYDDRAIQRRFFHAWGVDVLTAQGLPRAEADSLRERIERHLEARQIILVEGIDSFVNRSNLATSATE
jgi:DNA repair protein RadD